MKSHTEEPHKPIKLLSYNMSYASDLGIDPEKTLETFVNATGFKFVPSEINFLLNRKRTYLDSQPRLAWENAFIFLKTQINVLKPTFIGLQEMNRWYDYSNQMEIYGEKGHFYNNTERPTKGKIRTAKEMKLNNDEFGYNAELNEDSYSSFIKEGWTDLRGIEKVVDFIEKEQPGYDYFHDEVRGETTPGSNILAGRFSVMTIWHKPILGEFFAAQVFPFELDNSRPMLFVVVVKDDKYTLLINLHAPNKPNGGDTKKYDDEYESIESDIKTKYETFVESVSKTVPNKPLTFENIYMVGDFNDRYGKFLNDKSRLNFRTRDGLNKDIPIGPYSGEFMLGDKLLKFESDSAPNSCCYNWDSTKGDNSEKPLDGDIPEKKEKKKLPLPEDRAKEYYYIGDYAFSLKGGKLSVIQSDVDYSDHKMVMFEENTSTAETPQQGGRRRRSIRNLKRSTKKTLLKKPRSSHRKRKVNTHKK